jgi:hypothetical protein
MTTHTPSISRRVAIAITAAAATLVAAVTAIALGHDTAAIMRNAFGIAEKTGTKEVDRVLNGIGDLATPLLIIFAAATPIALIGGGAALAFGSRRGMQIIGAVMGGLAVAALATGIVS